MFDVRTFQFENTSLVDEVVCTVKISHTYSDNRVPTANFV